MKKTNQLLIVTLIVLGTIHSSYSQSNSEKKYELVLLAGTIQPFLLQGGNVELDFYTKKMVFNYSHGFSLDMNSELGTTAGDIKEQGLALNIPYSSGFGIGYRLNKYFDIRVEPKMHKFKVYYDGFDNNIDGNLVTSYNTITVGIGGYFRLKPFENKESWVNGIFTSTSLRYWPKVYTSLEGNKEEYFNRISASQETHKASNIGIANTPIIFNLAVGYSIVF